MKNPAMASMATRNGAAPEKRHCQHSTWRCTKPAAVTAIPQQNALGTEQSYAVRLGESSYD